ncbi:hypothetical protein [Jannaschia marina]|uniref:hypothetical protein n=1 Tax=Jannaschia marina TaxID=2741674 RepID=UPI0015C7AB46|nr:hypothetical protein [Jannaschia marina]
MAQDGITFDGEVVSGGGDGENEALEIEIPDTDPDFLIQAANKNPPSAWERIRAMISGAAEGAYSWPFDYTLCVHWILGHAGFYGARVQQNCFYHRDRILDVLGAGVRVIYYLIFRGLLWRLLTNETAQNAARDHMLPEDREAFDRALDRAIPDEERRAQIVGRYASGQFFTRWMQSRIRRCGGGNLETRGIAWTNTIMLMWGSAIHASHKHPSDFGIIEIFIAWITGDAEAEIDTETYVTLFRAAQSLTESAEFMDALGPDFELYREFIQALLDFGRAGGRS